MKKQLLFLVLILFVSVSCEEDEPSDFYLAISNPFNFDVGVSFSALEENFVNLEPYETRYVNGSPGNHTISGFSRDDNYSLPNVDVISYNFEEGRDYLYDVGSSSIIDLGEQGNQNEKCQNWKNCVYEQPNLLEPIHGKIYDNKFHTCLNGVLDDAGTPAPIQWQNDNKGTYTFTYPNGNSYELTIEYVPNKQHVLIYVEGTTPTVYEYSDDAFPCQ